MTSGWYWVVRRLPYMGSMDVFDVAYWDGRAWDCTTEPTWVGRPV